MKKSKIKEREQSKRNNQIKVAYAWTRVSTDKQKQQGSSIASQQESIQQYAAANNIIIKKWFGGGAETGTKVERKLFDDMLEKLKRDNQVNTILCYDSKRFGRLGGGTIVLKDELETMGVRVVYSSETNYDREDLGGLYADAIRDIGGKADAMYRKRICCRGTINMLNRGEWCYKEPLGYTRIKRCQVNNVAHHIFEINEMGELLRNAWIWRARGERVCDIVDKLNNMGLRQSNGNKMNLKSLSKILKNAFYTGWIEHPLIENPTHRVKGNFPALIDEATFNAANNISTHVGYEQAIEPNEYPLKRHIVCETCGSALTGYSRKRLVHTHYYYKCNTKGCCCNFSAAQLHADYAKLINSYNLRKEFIPILRKMLKNEVKNFRSENLNSDFSLKKQQTELQEKINGVEYRFAVGEIPTNTRNIAIKKLTDDMLKIENERKNLEEQLSNTLPNLDEVLQTCCKLGDYWMSSDFKLQQEIQNLLFPKGVSYSKILRNYRTPVVNKVFNAICYISNSCDDIETENDPGVPP